MVKRHCDTRPATVDCRRSTLYDTMLALLYQNGAPNDNVTGSHNTLLRFETARNPIVTHRT